MPLVKKIIRTGTSYAVVIPWEWVEWFKRKYGIEPREVVVVEVNQELRIIPILPENAREKEAGKMDG